MNRGRVLLLAKLGDSTRIVYHRLVRDFDVCALVLEDAVSKRELVTRRAKRLGLAKVAGQLAFRGLVVPALSYAAAGRIAEICKDQDLDRSPIDPQRVTRVPSVNSPEAIAALRLNAPDVVVVNGTRIISKETLACIPARFVNTHVGITPLYRGVHGGYWALVERDHEHFGVTIHLVDTGIDTGNILGQAVVRPTDSDNFSTYPYLQYGAAMPLLTNIVRNLLNGDVTTLPPPAGTSRLWSHPTLGQYLRNRLLWRVR